mmetsp:Transcript_33611/g.52295  ORF Transcript_33611/g.52295 Transcript_33611/m.52295 type:complete len:259 (+) Transcript_33611:117-893(+)
MVSKTPKKSAPKSPARIPKGTKKASGSIAKPSTTKPQKEFSETKWKGILYAPIQGPNGPLKQVFEDVWAVEGYFKMMPFVSIKRTMTIIRHEGELAIINAVRVDEATEKEIDKLGTVKHILRLTSGHGLDDPYYFDRYDAKLWSGPGATWDYKHGRQQPLVATGNLAKDSFPFKTVEILELKSVAEHPTDVTMKSGVVVFLPCSALVLEITFVGQCTGVWCSVQEAEGREPSDSWRFCPKSAGSHRGKERIGDLVVLT